MFRRAQTSVELLVVLAMSLVILAVLVDFTTTKVGELEREHSVRVARQSMEDLRLSVNQTFSQGYGSSRILTFILPNGLDSSFTRVSGKSILIRVHGTDIAVETNPIVTGSLPEQPGTYRIKLSAFDTNVFVGTATLSSSAPSIYLPMTQDSNARTSITLTNLSSQNATLSLSNVWDHNLVTTSAIPSSATLYAGGTVTIDFNASAQGSTIGNYTGSLTILATFPSSTETLTLPTNVEVFSPSGTLLSVFPSSLNLAGIPGDTNSVEFQVCNSGSTPLKTISFAPSSDDAGDWMQSISSISSLAGGTCQDVTASVTVPGSSSLGSYSGTLFITDFTGANSSILPFSVQVLGMSASFGWDWNTASVSSSSVSNYGMRNTRSNPIRITEMEIREWWSCDSNHSMLSTIVLNGSSIFSGALPDGNVANVTDTNIPGNTSYSNNSLTFDGTINDQNELFRAVVYFEDGTEYTSSVYGSGCAFDLVPPGQVTDLLAVAGPEPGDITLTFTYPGDDNFSGTASNGILKYSDKYLMSGDANFNLGIPYTLPSPIPAGGTTATITLTDLNVGYNYSFGLKFWDEEDNNSALSNAPTRQPWNRFQFRGDDFNFAFFGGSASSTLTDLNYFFISNITTLAGRDKNIAFRVLDLTSGTNDWYIILDFNTTHWIRSRIWYPLNAGVAPSGTPTLTRTQDSAFASGIDILSILAHSLMYANDSPATLVTMPRQNQFNVDWNVGISDFNLTFDIKQGTDWVWIPK